MKTKEELYQEIEKLKEVNLVDFVCSTANFRLDEDRIRKENKNIDNPKYVFVENDSGEKLLISRIYNEGRQQYVYKNLYNDFDKGNILSFIKNRSENYSIPTAKKKIQNFQANIEKGYYKTAGFNIELKGDDIKNNTESNLLEVQRKYQVLPDFKHTEYLRSRGLSEEILTSHLCQNRIKNEYIYFPKVSSKKPAIKYVNTVFPIYGSDGNKTFLCGFVRKNNGLKLTAADSKQSIGVWASDYRRNEKVTHLVLAENPIDALSYCQMNIDFKKDNPFLTASNGELTKTQMELYQEMVSRLRPDTIVLANDNNSRGQLFNAKILSSLKLDEKNFQNVNNLLAKAEILVGYKDKFTGEICWKIGHDKNDNSISKEDFILKHIPQFQKIVQHYENANKDLFLVNDEKYPFKIEKVFQDFHSEIKISFYNSNVNWVEINKSIIELKFDNSERFKIELSKNSDWNEDLKQVQGIVKISTEEKQEGLKV